VGGSPKKTICSLFCSFKKEFKTIKNGFFGGYKPTELKKIFSGPIISFNFMTSEKNEENFSLTFYSVLNHSDIGKCFCVYLKKQNKEEMWKFIVSSQLLEIFIHKSSKKRATAQIQQILTNFFLNENMKFLGNDENLKKKFHQIFQMKNESLDDIYPLIIDFKNIIMPIFKNHYLKQFNETKEARKLCETYKNQKKLVIQISKEYQVTEVDFESKEIKKRDIDYFRKLENEDQNDWLPIFSNEFMKLFQSYQHHLHDVKILEIPIVIRGNVIFDGNFQETAIGILHRFFENDSISVFFKVIEYNKDNFIVEQYVKRPPGNVRLRRLVCTLKYENNSIFGIMKPLKIPEMEFLKFKEVSYVKNGKEITERGVQDFYYSFLRISMLNENQTKFSTISIHDGRFGISGIPIDIIVQKCDEFYEQFVEKIKKSKGKKISDFKEFSNEIKDGFPRDPYAKMLFDLNIDQCQAKHEENNLFVNILENIKFKPQEEEGNKIEGKSSHSILFVDVRENICQSLPLSNLESEILVNISKDISKDQMKIKQESNNKLNTKSNFLLQFENDFCLTQTAFSEKDLLDESFVIDELQSIFDYFQ
jgi:hypothetical protein